MFLRKYLSDRCHQWAAPKFSILMRHRSLNSRDHNFAKRATSGNQGICDIFQQSLTWRDYVQIFGTNAITFGGADPSQGAAQGLRRDPIRYGPNMEDSITWFSTFSGVCRFFKYWADRRIVRVINVAVLCSRRRCPPERLLVKQINYLLNVKFLSFLVGLLCGRYSCANCLEL